MLYMLQIYKLRPLFNLPHQKTDKSISKKLNCDSSAVQFIISLESKACLIHNIFALCAKMQSEKIDTWNLSCGHKLKNVGILIAKYTAEY